MYDVQNFSHGFLSQDNLENYFWWDPAPDTAHSDDSLGSSVTRASLGV